MTANLGNRQDFDCFRTYLERVCGILLGDNKEYLVSSRLRTIMEEQSLTNLTQLVERIERNTQLREKVVDAMTTNETLWFRDSHPFRILREQLLPELSKEKRPIDIWCAASSTGQEPYSISIELEEYKRRNPGALMGERIIATDISPTALEIARRAEYEKLVLSRGMTDEYLKRYFKEVQEGRWKLNPEITSRVQYRSLNLLNTYSMLGRFDVVFCRNVLIYFSSDLKTDILRRIHSVLKPGGYLFLGASESLTGLSDLYEMRQCSPGIIYHRKG
ncbi:MAG: protein-glutamate O-methyltransferase CheR [Oceanospirillaceae bacterium]|nr:protein-glutamate O-methyltransferase CheR [Oceanospirillaceae bacterium]MCP5335351.1 protein-glutamate O-methyltransferase CheR [Oceanospirillaceae bacterium]MCP5350696.1 protein-glutamate O-methyltransferase CheR [Oceanospirillaceae bacterium]